MSYAIRPAERRDLGALTALAEAQALARQARDARLSSGPQLIPFLSSAQSLGDVLSWRGHATFVAEQNGALLGGINLRNAEQHDRDQFASYYPRRFTSIGLLATRADPPPRLVRDLITRAAEQAARWKTPALLFHNASVDGALRAALTPLGFRTYYHYALRGPQALYDAPTLPEVRVRPATRSDLDAIVGIGMESVHYHASLEYTMQVSRDEPKKMRRRFEAALHEPHASAVLAADYRGQVVGFYSIYTQHMDERWLPPLFAVGYYGLIAEVAVAHDFRHRGVGRLLFGEADRWFRARAVECYWLIYLPHNPLSSRFWPSLGFEPVWEVLLRDA